jgi:hypothetical protein
MLEHQEKMFSTAGMTSHQSLS